jgi:hypothetical protein
VQIGGQDQLRLAGRACPSAPPQAGRAFRFTASFPDIRAQAGLLPLAPFGRSRDIVFALRSELDTPAHLPVRDRILAVI